MELCFQRDENLRAGAKELLLHQWLICDRFEKNIQPHSNDSKQDLDLTKYQETIDSNFSNAFEDFQIKNVVVNDFEPVE